MSKSECNQNWIHVPAKLQQFLPYDRTFPVKVKGKVVTMRISRHGYMNPSTMIWNRFAKMLDFNENKDTLVFLTDEKNHLELIVEKG